MSIESLINWFMNCIYSTDTLMQHLQRAGSKSSHLLCGELAIAEENLHKCIAVFLEVLSPSLEA